MDAIVRWLGFKEMVRVNKTREKAKYKNFEICLDEVEGLGSFIEVEAMSETEDPEALQEELFEFLTALGVRQEDRVAQGYDTLVFLKNRKKTA